MCVFLAAFHDVQFM